MNTIRIIELLLVLCLSAYCQRYDASWWASSNHQTKIGYLNGESDCYQYEILGTDRHFSSIDEEVTYLDAFYRSPRDQKTTISDALRRGRKKTVTSSSISKGGDAHPKKHGYYDGGWWREIDSDQAREGFVEGYISCRIGSSNQVSKLVISRVRASIDKWYLANPSKSDQSIAVLIDVFTSRTR